MSRKAIKLPKTDVRYWEQKVAFQTPASRTYSVQIQHANRRAWIGLHTASKAEAAFEARKLYVELKANGWEETLRRRRKPDAPKKIGTTIGDFIDAVREKTAILPKTIESYALALRKIAADIAGLSGGSRDAWDVKLSRLTPEAIEAWRIGFIRRKAVNPLAEKCSSCLGDRRDAGASPLCRSQSREGPRGSLSEQLRHGRASSKRPPGACYRQA